MNKLIVFVLSVTLLTFMIAMPPVNADNSEITIEPIIDLSPECVNSTDGCLNISNSTVYIDGKVIFLTNDYTFHSFKSGVPGNPITSPGFETPLLTNGDSYEWNPTSIGDFPFFCLVHPWMSSEFNVVGTLTTVEPGLFYNPDNEHYYKYIEENVSWTEAKETAEGMTYNGYNGYLVTITSQSENDFVNDLQINSYSGIIPIYSWIGLTDVNSPGHYTWSNGEPFNYTNWVGGGDMVDYYDRDRVFMESDHGIWYPSHGKYLGNGFHESVGSYIVEFGPPDMNITLNPDNGNYYQIINIPGTSWSEALLFAKSSTFNGTGGHLVTITSQSENDFVSSILPRETYTWLGLYGGETIGYYSWASSENYEYSNWANFQPTYRTDEYYVVMSASNGKWNDTFNINHDVMNFIIEYSFPNDD